MRWRKVAVVATTEFNNAVRSRAFIASVLMLPLIYGAAILIQVYANKADTRPRPFAVVDHTGALYATLAERAESYNRWQTGADGKPTGPHFIPTPVPPGAQPAQELLLELSDRVRRGELFAFVEIPESILNEDTSPAGSVRYYSDTPTDHDLLSWLERALSDEVRSRRFERAGLDQVLVARMNAPVATENLGLLSRSAAAVPETPTQAGGAGAGTATAPPRIEQARQVDPVRTFAVPVALVFVMFLVIMSTTPQLMQSVLEEKMSKISEVLLGSVSPFELMLGKLVGNAGVALLLASLYLGGAYAAAAKYGYADIVPPYLLAAAVLYIVLAILLFGSLFMAVGAACSELKDAQSLMMPVMILALLPTFFWSVVLTKPSSPISVGVSLFPPATPFLMLMRMALSPAPPAWQVVLSIVLTTLAALACVWAAAKIFRTGLLMQGKPPSFAELARWVVAK